VSTGPSFFLPEERGSQERDRLVLLDSPEIGRGGRLAELRPIDAEFAHAGAQGVRIDTQHLRRAKLPFDAPMACLQCTTNVTCDRVIEAGYVLQRAVAGRL
jgi:hypothetical protein